MPCQFPSQGGGISLQSFNMKSLILHLSSFILLLSKAIGTPCPSLPPCKCHREWSRSYVTCTSIRNTATLSALIPQTQSEAPWVTIVNSDLRTLRSNAFGSLRVEKLRINASNVTGIAQDAFSGLEGLRGLFMTDNELGAVPAASLRPLVNLEVLGLAGNRITAVNDRDLTFLTSLQYLSLSENFITDIEKGSFPVSLIHLGLVANQLETLNGAIAGLRNLEWLLLGNNSLRTLNAREFESLDVLERLSLPNNVLEDIAGAFDALTQLKFLNLNGNRIRSIEGVFNSVPKLKQILLRGNEIRRLKNFGTLPALSALDLSENGLELIFFGAFENTPNIIMLNLSNNELDEFPRTVLTPLHSLVTLDLSRNQLQSPIDVTQLRLPTLKHLNLSGNKLTTLPDNLYESFPSLQDLDVTFNLLTTLNMFPTIPLKTLHLHGNPLRCDLATIKVLDKMTGRFDRPRCINAVLPISQEDLLN